MFLEQIKALPKKVIENMDGDLKNLKIYLVQDYDLKFLQQMVNFSQDIFGDSSLDEWGMVPQIRQGNVFVLKEEGARKLSGLAILMRGWEDKESAYLFDFAISEEHQGQGLGFHFLKGIIENLIEQGFQRMSLTVNTENHGAIHLYKDKLGFRTLERKDHEYGQGEHRYIMELDFQQFLEDKAAGKFRL